MIIRNGASLPSLRGGKPDSAEAHSSVGPRIW